MIGLETGDYPVATTILLCAAAIAGIGLTGCGTPAERADGADPAPQTVTGSEPGVEIDQSGGYSADEAYALRRAFTIDNWDDGGELMRYVFLHMGEFFHEAIIHRGGPIRSLDYALRDEIGEFEVGSRRGEMTLDAYIQAAAVDGLIIVGGGQIVFESYPRMRQHDKHLLMSVSKAYASTLVAILEDRGEIDSRAPLETYLPELSASGWAGVRVIDVLDMASGIDCHETNEGAYTDPQECYYQYEASLGWLGPTESTYGSPYEYIAGLRSHRRAGEAYEYTSPNTFVLSWLIERITGQTYAEVLSREIWQRIGTESDGLVSTPKQGIPIAHGGISATLRDVARFGLLFTPSWSRVTDVPLISQEYAEKIRAGGRSEIFDKGINTTAARMQVDGEMPRHSTYQWDFVMDDGDFFKGGYGGSGLYVSPSRDLVIAFFGTFESGGPSNELKQISRQLAKSGLFD